MAKQTFRIGCVLCGNLQVTHLDLDEEDDVASLGITMARLLDDGHTVLATPEDIPASVVSIATSHPSLN